MNDAESWFRRKKDPEPTPDAIPEKNDVGLSKYLKAWQLFRKIPVQKLFPAVLSVSTVIFFAISGLLAWLVLFGSFVLRLFKIFL